MFKLVSTSGEQSIDLQLGRTLVVGRAVTSDVPIYDPTISRRHAEIALTNGGVRVKDLGSSNGTFLNGARVTEAEAASNDVVTFGKVAFRVQDVTAVHLQPISYVSRPTSVQMASSYRMYITATSDGEAIEAPVFATERHRQEDVQALVHRLLAAAQGTPASTAPAP